MSSIYNFTRAELAEQITPKFRVNQIYNWLYKKYVDNFASMKNLPKEMQEKLSAEFELYQPKILKKETSVDGSIKYLFELHDGHTVETVLLKMKEERYTVCVSTQVGCKVGCSFCFTAKGGFVRNLEVGEIINQVLLLKKDNEFPENKSLNIVYMGMGEPLDNYENLVSAIKIFSDDEGLAISVKRQTVSTSGISTKIERLGVEDLGVHIAISLHAVDDTLRTELIPMNKAYNIQSIIDAVKKYPYDNRKRVMFEYLVIKDVNDDIASAKKLVKILNGIKAKVNLIYFNPHEGSPYQRPTKESMIAFQEYLLSKDLVCTIRESKGIDISAACGQLREKENQNKGWCGV